MSILQHPKVEWFMESVFLPGLLIVICLPMVISPFAIYYQLTHPKPVVKPPPPVCNCVCPPPTAEACPHVP